MKEKLLRERERGELRANPEEPGLQTQNQLQELLAEPEEPCR